jgi:DNA-binding NarL/FixJ family response regulator
MIDLAVDSLYVMQYDEMQTWAERAVEGSTPLADRTLRAAALAVRALAAALAGIGPPARRYCEEAAAFADNVSDEELARRLDTLANLATADFYLDRFEEASAHAQRALAIGRATGQGDLFPLIVSMLGGTLWMRGRMLEAGDVLDGALEAARLLNNIQGTTWHLFNRSFAALAAGDIELALSTAEESYELSKQLDKSPVTAHAAIALAAARFETGEPGPAADLLLTSGGGEELRPIGGGFRARYLELLTRCLIGADRVEEAQRAAAAAQSCADDVQSPMASAMAACAAALLDLHAGKPTPAADKALTAAAALEEVGAAFDAATARRLAGRALAQAGEREKAAAEFQRAAEAFDSFGSTRYRDEAEGELRKLGQRVHRRTRPGSTSGDGIATLTARELEVARLVVDRKTNPQIAAELFLSQKTIEAHLRNTFRKVGVTSRVELARAVERADRATRER